MTLPGEILRLLPPGLAVQATAAVSCSPASSVGETRLVLADSRLFAFVRESLIGEFAQLALDPAFPVRLVGDDFSTVLQLRPENAPSIDLRVSTFERADVARLLALLPADAGAATVPAAPQAASASPGPVQGSVQPVVPDSAAAMAPAQSSVLLPPPMPQPPTLPPVLPTAVAGQKELKDEFSGELPFLTGCLPGLIIWIGATVGLWFLEEALRLLLAEETNWKFWLFGVAEVVGKAIAIAAGLAAAIGAGVLLDDWNFRTNRSGRVTIRNGRLVVLAPKLAWKVDLPLAGATVEFQCQPKQAQENQQPEQQQFSALIKVSSRGESVGISINSITWKEIASSRWQGVATLTKPPLCLPMLSYNFGPMSHRLVRELDYRATR